MFESSGEMAAALTTVVDAPTAALNSVQLLDQLSVIGQLESVIAAQKAETMVAFHAALSGPSADLGHQEPRPGDRIAGPTERRWSGDVLRSVTDEIGLVLGAHRRTAACWLNRAALLVDRFPATLALLRLGGIPALAAQHLAKALAVIVDDDLRAAVEELVLAWGRRYGWIQIKKVAIREARKVTAEYDSLLHAQRQDERTTYTVKHDGGIADLVVSTSAIDITAIMNNLTERCRELQQAGDPRSLDQLRTDLAVHRLLGHDQTNTGDPRTDTADTEPTADASPAADPDGAQPTTDTSPATDAGTPAEPTAHAQPTAHADPAANTGLGPTDATPTGIQGNPDAATSDVEGEPTPVHDNPAPSRPATDGQDTTGSQGADEIVAEEVGSEEVGSEEVGVEEVGVEDPDTDSGPGPGAPHDAAPSRTSGRGAELRSVPPESGLNPAVGVQVVIHCSYAEAEALATGAINTGGELEGYGPLPQDALAMAFNRAKFRYRLTDRSPKSDPGRHTPSPALDQHVRDRDQRCRFPGCNAPVRRCDLDHRVPFPAGPTDEGNLEPFCRHHHRLKHHGDWQVLSTDTGTLVFISPTGRVYLEPPTRSEASPGTPSVESRPEAAPGTPDVQSRPEAA